MSKKRILLNTDYILLNTGLARAYKEVLLYLFNTQKYDIALYACGMTFESPDYDRLPFKCFGALPNNPVEIEQLNRDPGRARDAAYGEYNINKVIELWRPDVAVFGNDSWAVSPMLSKPFWNKIHCIPHTTIDSENFLDDQIKLVKASKKLFVWADFAKEEYNRLGYNNVEIIRGPINPKFFYKLNKNEALDLRQKFNIPKETFICGFVFRNQIRKKPIQIMEGYSIFKKRNPSIKNTKLLFHTHFSEPQGWDIPRFRDIFNIPKEDILTTYICRGCKNIEVRYFDGQDLDCKSCGAQKSQITCNVAVGATEEDLNKVYNLMDCYCHIADAAGQECPIQEAMYCELPVGTMDYAACSTYTRQPFVYTIDNTWDLQHGTQFKRAVVSVNSIAKFLEKMYEAKPEERAKLGKLGREWTIKNYSPEVVGKQWEDYIDSLPPVDWDYKFDFVPKNPMAAIDMNVESDLDFVLQLYDKILNMKMDPTTDEGVAHWLKQLSAVK